MPCPVTQFSPQLLKQWQTDSVTVQSNSIIYTSTSAFFWQIIHVSEADWIKLFSDDRSWCQLFRSSSSSSNSHPLISSAEYSLSSFPNSDPRVASSASESKCCSGFMGDFGESTWADFGVAGAWRGEGLSLDPSTGSAFAFSDSMLSVGLSIDSNDSLSFSISSIKFLTSGSSFL